MIFDIYSSKDFSSKQAIFNGEAIFIGINPDDREKVYTANDLISAEIMSEKPCLNKPLGFIVGVSIFFVCLFLFGLIVAIIVPLGVGFLWGQTTKKKEVTLKLKFADNRLLITGLIKDNELITSLTRLGAENAERIKKDQYRTCPYCAETIKKDAILCKHCGMEVQSS